MLNLYISPFFKLWTDLIYKTKQFKDTVFSLETTFFFKAMWIFYVIIGCQKFEINLSVPIINSLVTLKVNFYSELTVYVELMRCLVCSKTH